MPIITSIPDRYEGGFKELASLSDESFAKIEDALISVEQCSSNTELAAKVASLKELEAGKIQNIFYSIDALIGFLEEEEDIDAISIDAAKLCVEDNWINVENEERLKKR